MQVYEAIKEELASGGRAYIICPLVGESTTKALADVKVRALLRTSCSRTLRGG